MLRAILVLAAIGVTIYALVDCLRSDAAERRGLPKPLWAAVIILLAPFGAVIWLVVTRRPPTPGPVTSPRPPVAAPDDDIDFLRSLDPDRDRPKKRPGDGTRQPDGNDPDPS